MLEVGVRVAVGVGSEFGPSDRGKAELRLGRPRCLLIRAASTRLSQVTSRSTVVYRTLSLAFYPQPSITMSHSAFAFASPPMSPSAFSTYLNVDMLDTFTGTGTGTPGIVDPFSSIGSQDSIDMFK